MANTIYFRGKRADLADFLRGVPRALQTEAGGLVDGLKLRVANALLSDVQQDFETKARGGTGRDGIKWAPLKRETVAGREPPRHKRRGERPRGLLTMKQDDLWRAMFAKTYARLAWVWDDARAKAGAAAAAWAAVKAVGGKTRLEALGDRQVEILRDKGLLFRSFTPAIAADGPADRESGAPGQVVRLPAGSVVVGTNVKPWHHAGISGKLPARPFWPSDGSIPAAWWSGIRLAAARGLRRMIELSVGRGR